jgi:hypothetical protein
MDTQKWLWSPVLPVGWGGKSPWPSGMISSDGFRLIRPKATVKNKEINLLWK